MPSLICDVKNCSHNEENYCCLSAIDMGKSGATNQIETCCENFTQSAYMANNVVKEKQVSVEIKCMAAGCIYNMAAVCTAECVPVTGVTTACCNSEDTLCGAFICR